MTVSLMDFDFVVIMLHVLLSSEVLSRNHVFYQLIDQFLRSALHLTSHQEGGSPCEWPALSSFMQTMMFQFGQSCTNLLTGLGYTDCGIDIVSSQPESLSRHNITHFSVRSLQSKSPAAKFNDGVDIVDVLNFHDAVQGHPHVDLPSFRGHCVCMVFFFVYICASTTSIY